MTNTALATTTVLLTMIPLALSAWLFMRGRGGASLPGCGPQSDCEAVTKSRYAWVGSIPVSLLGTSVYLSIIVSVSLMFAPSTRSAARHFLLFASALAVGGAGWFLLVQAVVLRKFCSVCVVTHLGGLAAAAVAFAVIHVKGSHDAFLILVAAIAVLALITSQQLLPIPQQALFVSRPLPSVPALDTSSDLPPPVPSMQPPIERRVQLQRGRVQLSMADWPLLGQGAARYVIAWLFDFTCKECHHQHRVLRETISRFEGHLAVLPIPVPMHPACNPTVTCRAEDRSQACAYARLTWAVWISAPQKFAEWDAFMIEDAQRQPFGLALRRASQLADITRYNVAEPDAELDARIAAGIEVYQKSLAKSVPALLLPGGILSGHIKDSEELLAMLRKHLTVRLGGK